MQLLAIRGSPALFFYDMYVLCCEMLVVLMLRPHVTSLPGSRTGGQQSKLARMQKGRLPCAQDQVHLESQSRHHVMCNNDPTLTAALEILNGYRPASHTEGEQMRR